MTNILNILKKSFCYASFFISLVSLDVWSKNYVKEKFTIKNTEYLLESNFLDIKNLCNTGISLGLFSSMDKKYLKVLTAFVLIILIIYLFFMLKKEKSSNLYFGLMIVAGAISNLFDRIQNGCVYDFIDFHFYDYHWYVFNLADTYITVGTILLLFYMSNTKNKKYSNFAN